MTCSKDQKPIDDNNTFLGRNSVSQTSWSSEFEEDKVSLLVVVYGYRLLQTKTVIYLSFRMNAQVRALQLKHMIRIKMFLVQSFGLAQDLTVRL